MSDAIPAMRRMRVAAAAAQEPYTSRILPSGVHAELWQRVRQRLEAGEALYLTRHFQRILEQEYRHITGAPPEPALQSLLRIAVAEYNKARPDVYVRPGLQNAVSQTFDRGVQVLRWSLATVQRFGPGSVKGFLRRPWVQGLFRSLRVSPEIIDARHCVRVAVRRLVGEPEAASAVGGPAPEAPVHPDAGRRRYWAAADRGEGDEPPAATVARGGP